MCLKPQKRMRRKSKLVVKVEKNYAKRYANEYHFVRKLFQAFAVYILSLPYFKLCYNIKKEGLQNIPKGSNYIYAGNHVSMLDPLFVSYAVLRPIVYMAKKELFEMPKLGWWIKKLGSFLVDRDKPQISTFKTVREVFKTDWALGIFPQGGIKENKKIENIERGFVAIAKSAKVDIIPVSISGFEGYAKTLFAQNVRIKVGTPISYELPAEEIILQWSTQICDATGFENCILPEKEMSAV